MIRGPLWEIVIPSIFISPIPAALFLMLAVRFLPQLWSFVGSDYALACLLAFAVLTLSGLIEMLAGSLVATCTICLLTAAACLAKLKPIKWLNVDKRRLVVPASMIGLTFAVLAATLSALLKGVT